MNGTNTLKTFFKTIGVVSFFSLALLACQNNGSQDGKTVEEFQADGKISSIIRNPITMDGTVDTVNVAKMEFETTVFDFGEVQEGDVISHVFKFTNKGKVPLVINNAQSTCGCTVPSWPDKPILPGGNGELKVEFNTSGKTSFQEKPVTISANTLPSTTKVYVKGMVRPNAQ